MSLHICIVLASLVAVVVADPLVTLPHGGQLEGVQMAVGDRLVDQFLGVRYAQPPVKELRFKKPAPIGSWSGVTEAKKFGSPCLQPGFPNPQELLGDEDCLFLNVYVPRDTQNTEPKPVMVWIHGGGYSIGSAEAYVGSMLALHGDVIVVGMNYRLGVLGFFASEPGTGNYGLWDQREALVWVKENIAAFGGDPDMVTLFGESAGAGSVAAQMMGQHNEGLFHRAISQSGSLYAPWGWYSTYERYADIIKQTKANIGCEQTSSIYDCYRPLSGEQVVIQTPAILTDVTWKPIADGDFFPDNIDDETYDLASRFDLMAGFNGREGGLVMALELLPFVRSRNESSEDGCSLDLMAEFLLAKCSLMVTTDAPELCAEFLAELYDMDTALDDRDRALRIADCWGRIYFDVDSVDMLSKHSQSDKKTFGYYFTKTTGSAYKGLWESPSWATDAADHSDELIFMFGLFLAPDSIFDFVTDKEHNFLGQLKERVTATDEIKELSRKMMTMWTNFAKTGDPNLPVRWDETNAVTWPQVSAGGKFLELADEIRVIDTPNKAKLDKTRRGIKTLIRRKYLQAKEAASPVAEKSDKAQDAKDEL